MNQARSFLALKSNIKPLLTKREKAQDYISENLWKNSQLVSKDCFYSSHLNLSRRFHAGSRYVLQMNKIELSLDEEKTPEDETLLKVIFANAPLESKKIVFLSLSEVYIEQFSLAIKHRKTLLCEDKSWGRIGFVPCLTFNCIYIVDTSRVKAVWILQEIFFHSLYVTWYIF